MSKIVMTNSSQGDEPLVSVVMPCYNHEEFVRAAIDSILRQTYKNWELIIIDDSSSDHSVREIKKVSDPRIKLSVHRENMGISLTLNECIANATGDFIAFHASDDLSHPRRIEMQQGLMALKSDLGAVFCRPDIINRTGKLVRGSVFDHVFAKNFTERRDWCLQFIFSGNILCAGSAFIRKEVFNKIGHHSLVLHQLQDMEMWLRITLSFDIEVMKDHLVQYRVDANMNSASLPSRVTENRTSIEYFTILRSISKLDRSELTWLFPELLSAAETGPELLLSLADIFLTRAEGNIHKLFAQTLKYELLMPYRSSSERDPILVDVRRLVMSELHGGQPLIVDGRFGWCMRLRYVVYSIATRVKTVLLIRYLLSFIRRLTTRR